MSCAVIFGGTGFIGSFFAKFLLEAKAVNYVYLVDLEAPAEKVSRFRRDQLQSDARLRYVKGDVRESLDWFSPDEAVSLVANFAAVHREPGHENFEYYQTNLLGAENVCAWVERVGCERIIFTSSISPYGVSETRKDESSLPNPDSAYGGSKLAAEKIHQIWQSKDESVRRLIIVRPGVVFGPGEGGNVSRLIRAVLGRYFFYMGNRNTRKAGVYVMELCHALWWAFGRQVNDEENVILFNMSMDPGPSISEYVEAICAVSGVRRIALSLPYGVLLLVARVIEIIATPLRLKHPFSPVRVRKLVRSNNIAPTYLVERSYSFRYSLESALSEWREICPEEWG